MKPSAPALATAATSSARPTHCIPPCTIGCSTPTSSVNRVLIIGNSCLFPPSCPREGGASSNPRSQRMRSDASDYWIARSSRAMTTGRMPSCPANVHRARALRSTVRSRRNGSGRFRGFVVERGRDVADADHADQAVIVDHRQVANVVLAHEMTDVFERVGRAAGHQLLHRNQLRNLQVDAGGAMLGDGANHVALGKHADRGTALGVHDVLDHQRADIAGAHQLRGDADGFGHPNHRHTGGLLAQDVSDFHRNLLMVNRNSLRRNADWYTPTNCQTDFEANDVWTFRFGRAAWLTFALPIVGPRSGSPDLAFRHAGSGFGAEDEGAMHRLGDQP